MRIHNWLKGTSSVSLVELLSLLEGIWNIKDHVYFQDIKEEDADDEVIEIEEEEAKDDLIAQVEVWMYPFLVTFYLVLL